MTRPPEAPPAGSGPGNGHVRPPAGLRVAGFGIRLTFGAYVLSMLAVLAGALTLPRLAPGLPAVAYLAATAGLVLGFLVSLAAHEVAHAAVRRAQGADITEIPIGFFGGPGHVRGESRTPGALARAAAAGPAANLALAAASAGAAAGLAALGAGPLVFYSFAAVATLNILITVVNALPGAGLDGGQVVHALAWKRSGDRARGAVTAARVGQFTGALLVAGGVALLALGYLDGIWAGLIGLVMVSTSRAQAREVLTITALAGVRVRDLLADRRPPAVSGWQTVREFLDTDLAGGVNAAGASSAASTNLSEAGERLARDGADPGSGDGAGAAQQQASWHGSPVTSGLTAFPVLDFDGRLAGLVTLSQLATVPAARRETVRVAEVATPIRDVVTTTPEEPMTALVSRLQIRPTTPAAIYTAGHVLVTGGQGEALGVLTPADFARASQLGALHTGSPMP